MLIFEKQLCMKGWGDPIRTTGKKAWISVYSGGRKRIKTPKKEQQIRYTNTYRIRKSATK